MSYVMHQGDTQFRIPLERKKAALNVLREWASKPTRISWADNQRIIVCLHLEDALDELGWDAEMDEDYNITDIQFSAEKLGDEAEFFALLAPYVEAGSFIEMRGEDGERWRWTFDGSTMREQRATVSWQ